MFNDGFWLLLSGRIFHPATLLTIITWLAHPFIWVGLGFIATGQSRRAALCGGMALVCTVCLLPLYQLHTIRFAGFWLLLGAAWALWYLHALHRDLLSAPATNSWQSIENSWKMTGQGLSKYDGR